MIFRGHIRLPKATFQKKIVIDSSLMKLIPNSDFSLCHTCNLKSDLKVPYMEWEVKTDMRSHANHSLWGSNVKRGKYLPANYQ